MTNALHDNGHIIHIHLDDVITFSMGIPNAKVMRLLQFGD